MSETTTRGYREKCIDAKGEVCKRCDGNRLPDGQLVVHHIDEDRSNNQLSNLIPLCRACHQVWHGGRCRMSFQEFLDSYPETKFGEPWRRDSDE